MDNDEILTDEIPNDNDYRPEGIARETIVSIPNEIPHHTSTIDMGYQPNMVDKLIRIRERAWAYTWLHRENAQYLKAWYDRVSYINIVFQLVTGTSIFVTASACGDAYYIRFVTGMITVVTGFISGFLKHREYGEEIMRHRTTASKYSRIYDTIDGQLNTPVQAQQQAHHFHNWISNEFEALFSTSPDLDETVIKLYIKKFGQTRMIHPIEAAEFEPAVLSGGPLVTDYGYISGRSSSHHSSRPPSRASNHPPSRPSDSSMILIGPSISPSREPLGPSLNSPIGPSRGPSRGPLSPSPIKLEPSQPNENALTTKLESSIKPNIEKGASSSSTHSSTRGPQTSLQNTETDSNAEKALQEYLKQIKAQTSDRFNPSLYNYQINRMSLNTDKCYIDPFEITTPRTSTSRGTGLSKKLSDRSSNRLTDRSSNRLTGQSSKTSLTSSSTDRTPPV